MHRQNASFVKAIVLGGLTAAFLDILDPMLFYRLRGVPAIRILQSVASGVLGRAAYSGGWRTALLGLLLHSMIALAWATLFVLMARFVPLLHRHAVSSGLLYGLFIYAVMNYLVLPLSRVAPSRHPALPVLLNGILAIVFLVGLPISLWNRRLAPAALDSGR